MNRRTAISAMALSSLSAGLSRRLSAKDDQSYLRDDYVQRAAERNPDAFLASILQKDLPGLGQLWLLPPHLLVSREQRSSWFYVNAFETKPRAASFLRRLEPSEALALAREFPDAMCEPHEPWFAYRVWHEVAAKTQVFGFPEELHGVQFGAKRVPVPPRLIEPLLGAPLGSDRAQSEALVAPDRDQPLSFVAQYDQSSQVLKTMTIGLHASDWTLIAQQRTDVHHWCDGCAIPTFARGLDPVFGVTNLMALPDLPYPLILADRSSVESRTLQISTFTAQGHYALHELLYQFVGCPSLALPANDGHAQQPP